MPDKSPRQSMSKKTAGSIKQKRSDRKAKAADANSSGMEKLSQNKKR